MKKSIIYKIIIILVGIFSLIATTGLLDGHYGGNIFKMFTTLINLLCVLYYIFDVIYLIIKKKDLLPILKQMVLIGMTLTFLIVIFVLRMGFGFSSFMNASFLGLHFIVPIMVILDYFLFDKKGLVKSYSPLIWIILPLLYLIINIILVEKGIINNYPYLFIDINSLGLKKVITNISIITLIYFIFTYSFYFLDKRLNK
ncbi:MAG TPA: Pr6Pr family membrane protein [Bacilli bacterium]|nr:Pr6Pr family membrane protein [Bacilli bacterium]